MSERQTQRLEAAPIERGPFSVQVFLEFIQRIQGSRTACYLLVTDGLSEKCFFFPVGGVRMLSIGPRRGRTLTQALQSIPGVTEAILHKAHHGGSEDASFDASERQIAQDASTQIIRDELLDLCPWDGAEYEFRESNPPSRLSEHNVEAIKLSLGVPALLREVKDAALAYTKIQPKLGIPSRGRVSPGPKYAAASAQVRQAGTVKGGPAAEEFLIVGAVEQGGVRLDDLLLEGRRLGVDAVATAQILLRHVERKTLLLEIEQPTPKQVKARARKEVDHVAEAIDRFINQMAARKRLARSLAAAGEGDRAIHEFRALGRDLARDQRYEEALGAYQEIVGIAPQAFDAREEIAKLYQQLQRIPDALKSWLGLARDYAKIHLFNRSQRSLRHAIEIEPKNRDHRRRLIDLLMSLGRSSEAGKELRELGELCQGEGDLDDAAVCFHQALQLNPQDAELRRGLSRVAHKGFRYLAPIAALVLCVLGMALGALAVHRRYQALKALDTARSQALEQGREERFADAHATLDAFQAEHDGFQRQLTQTREALTRLRDYAAERLLDAAREEQAGGKIPAARATVAELLDTFDDAACADDAHALASELEELVDGAAAGAEQARALIEEGLHDEAFATVRALRQSAPWSEDVRALRLPLRVTSDPPGAQLIVNGDARGTTPLVLSLTETTPFEVRWLLDDFQPLDRTVDPTADELTPPLHGLLTRAVRWRRVFSGPLGTPPTQAGRHLALAGQDHKLYLLGAEGRPQWSRSLGVFNDTTGSVLLTDDQVVVATSRGDVLGLDQDEGTLRWRRDLAAEVPGVRPVGIVAGGAVFAGEAAVIALDPTSGATRWTLPLPSPLSAPATITARGDVIAPLSDGRLTVIDPANGNARGAVPLGERPATGAVYAAGGLIVVTEANQLKHVWRSARWVLDLPAPTRHAPAVDGDHLYVACGATLWAVSARDGSRVWERRFEAPLGPPVAAEGRLYVTSEDGHAFALLPSSGADRWRFERAGVTFATPAPHGRLVYLAGSDGVLYAIRD